MKLKTLLITATLTLSLLTSTAFATGAEDFTDIVGHSQYTHIATAIELGLFSGTSATTFDPDATISQAQFLTVIMRAITGGSDAAATGSEWWSGTYYAAIEAGIITSNMFPMSGMNDDITREQMAYMLTEALEYMGEDLDANIDSSRIPDYYDVTSAYRNNVLIAYSNGLLVGGVDGNFSPDGTMTRATACVVLSRLVVEENRTEVMSDAEYYAEQAQAELEEKQESTSTVQTIYESTNSYRTPAKEGDIYVKSDGTTVTLVRDSNGVLMGSDGSYVAADLGMKSQVDTVRSGDMFNFETELNGAGIYVDYYGNSLQNQTYYVLANGMGIWQQELNVLRETITAPSYSGTDGEVSSDAYGLYIWYDMAGCWVSNT